MSSEELAFSIPSSETGLWKIDEVARHLKVSRRKVQLEIQRGALAHVKMGRNVRFRPEDVEAYILARRIGSRRVR